MNFQEMLDRIKKTDGFEIIELNNENIYIYDIYEDRFLNYRNLDELDFLQLFDFLSLKIKTDNFIKILKLLDKKLLMKVNKVYFIKNKDDLNNILDIYLIKLLVVMIMFVLSYNCKARRISLVFKI